MKKRKAKFWAIGGIVVLIAGLFGSLGLFGLLPWQGGELYKDPQRRFTMQVDPSWEQVERGERYAHFKIADPPQNLYVLVLEAGTVDDAYSQAFEALGFDQRLLKGGGIGTFGEWQAYTQMDAA
jgi:hypothetical protein